METKTGVMVAIPTEHSVHHRVVDTLCRIIIRGDYNVQPYISVMHGIGEHRNRIVKEFLDTDLKWLMMMDSDNPCPPNVLDLIKLDKDVIALPTPINMNWNGVTNIFWNVFGKDGLPSKDTGKGLQQVEKVGTGCILIHRRVLEKLKHPFTTVRDKEDLRIVGTDIAFSNKCTEAGFKIYVHWDYTCRHYKEIDLLTIKERMI